MAEETTTYCLKDFRNKHHWSSIGVIALHGYYQVFKCSQCNKIMLEELNEIRNT